MVLRQPDANGQVVCKLLDFGLSKNAGGGSAAKTFVGTPCYLAPEVEYTSKGLGGTYGLPADCWSLGAVLYVMLVARFPEFEQDLTGKVGVVLISSVALVSITNLHLHQLHLHLFTHDIHIVFHCFMSFTHLYLSISPSLPSNIASPPNHRRCYVLLIISHLSILSHHCPFTSPPLPIHISPLPPLSPPLLPYP